MLTVLLSAVTSTVAVRTSLKSQYYNQLSQEAGDAGVAYAKSCMAANGGIPQWSDSKPLMPNTDCNGDQIAGFTCSENSVDPRCSLMVTDDKVVVSFSVPAPSPDSNGNFTNISANGRVDLLRSSDGSVWRQYSRTVKSSNVFSLGYKSDSWKQVSTGSGSTCAVNFDGIAYCWGDNSLGGLGNGSTINSSIPVAIDTTGVLAGLTIKSVSVGDRFACSVASNDQSYCWGYNFAGQLGNGDMIDSLVPVRVVDDGVLDGMYIKSLAAGSSHVCAIASNDKVYCWGNLFGNGSTGKSSVPIEVFSTGVLSGLAVQSIVSGDNYSCVIASDQAYCWGVNSKGELGNGLTATSLKPVAIVNTGALSGLMIKSISAGGDSTGIGSHTCVIASNDKAYCWGYNNKGQLGNNSIATSYVPSPVSDGALPNMTVKSIDNGGAYTCAIAFNGQAYCWGFNNSARLGNGLTIDSLVPIAVSNTGVLNGLTITSISSAYSHSCVLASDDQAYCWGSNVYGQYGDGTVKTKNVPSAVIAPLTSIRIGNDIFY